MSEVHMQLERATLENRRLQSALRVAHEQISDLYFNKRVLEAEMTALRSDRDQQVAEANERIRMAERAVVAATSRRRLAEPITVSPAVQSSPARGAIANQTDAEGSIATGCLLSRVQPTYTTFRPVDRKSRDVNRFKQYATLTAMNYDDFDSLDEDENVVDSDATADETATMELPEPHTTSDKLKIQPISQSSVDNDGSFEANRNEINVLAVNALPPSQSSLTEEAAGDLETPSSIDAVDTVDVVLPSPSSSSTPRKSVDLPSIESLESPVYARTPALTRPDTVTLDTVPRADYLKLLDELDELRQELDAVRRTQVMSNSPDCPPHLVTKLVVPAETSFRSPVVDRGLTDQSHEPAGKIQVDTPSNRQSMLPSSAPGTTRFFDWSVSLNQSVASPHSHLSEDEEEDEDKSKQESDLIEVETPTHKESPPVCESCLILQARLLAVETIGSIQMEESSRLWATQIAKLESKIHQLQDELQVMRREHAVVHSASSFDYVVPLKWNTADQSVWTQTNASLHTSKHTCFNYVMCLTGKCDVLGYAPELSALDALCWSLNRCDFCTVSDQTELQSRFFVHPLSVTATLQRYSRLSADAACICLALAQRIASLNRRGVPDGEQSAEYTNDFNTLLSALSVNQLDDNGACVELDRSGYKILGPALTQLNHEVERLASVMDAEFQDRFDNHSLFQDTDGVLDPEVEVAELRTRLSAVLQLLAAKLPPDTQKVLAETTQIVEAERLQLQAELERRIVQLEQSHSFSLTELEASRRSLIEQLATSEAANLQLKDELSVLQQKLQAKERFLAEQTDERETEREEFRAELTRLEKQLQATKGELLASKLINGASTVVDDASDGQDQWNTTTLSVDSDDFDYSDPDTPVRDSRRQTWFAPPCTTSLSIAGSLNRRFSEGPVRPPSSLPSSERMRNNNNVHQIHFSSTRLPTNPPATAGMADAWTNTIASVLPDLFDKETFVELDQKVQLRERGCYTCPLLSDALVQTDNEDSALRTEIVTLREQLANRLQNPSHPTVSDTRDASVTALWEREDAWTQFAGDDSSDSEAVHAVRTTKTVRKILDARTAAAILGQFTLTEESTVVTHGSPVPRGWSCDSDRVRVLEFADKATCTDSVLLCVKNPTSDASSEYISKRERSLSSPSLTSPSAVTQDTGIDMSQSVVVSEANEQVVAHNTTTSVPLCTAPFVDPPVLEDSDDVHFHTSDTSITETVVSSKSDVPATVDVLPDALFSVDENFSIVSSHESSPHPQFTTAHVEVMVDVRSPDKSVPDGLRRIDHSLIDGSSNTDDLQLDFIPTSDLQALLEQKATCELLVNTMRSEIEGLQKYQEELQSDYNILQSMLDDRESELERCTNESLALQARCVGFEKELMERKNVVLERDEDMFLLTEQNESLQAKICELEKQLEFATHGTHCSVDAFAQTDLPTSDTRSCTPSAATEACRMDTSTMEDRECSDTIVDGGSSLHSLNDAATEESGQQNSAPVAVAPVCASTPDDRSAEINNHPDEVQALIRGLREAHQRATAQIVSSTPADAQAIPETHGWHGNESSVNNYQPNAIVDLVRANTALKRVLTQLTNVVESYENPCQTSASASLSKDNLQQLIQCTSNALVADELVWLNMLQSSAADIFRCVSSCASNHEPVLDTILPADSGQDSAWNAMRRLADQLTAFMQHEEKYRECFTRTHLLEKQCLSADLKVATTRTDSLSAEVDRLSDRLTSQKQALDRADGLNLRLANQVSDLKTDLAKVTAELQTERLESEQKQAKLDRISSQLADEQRTSDQLRTQSDAVKKEASRLQQELKIATDTLLFDFSLHRSFTVHHLFLCWIKSVVLWAAAQGRERRSCPRANCLMALERAVHCAINLSDVTVSPEQTSLNNSSTNTEFHLRSLSASPKDLFHALNSFANNLAIARHTATKAERRARELQSINNALRLNLAETELRVMPFLVSCTRSQLPNSSPNAPVLHELNQAKHSSETKQRHPSSRFAELKSVCTRLLSLAAADQIGVDDGSSSASTSDADDDGDVTRLRAAPKAVSFHPSVHQTEKQRAFDLSAPVTPKLTNEMDHIVDRDLESSRNIRNPALSVSRTSTGSNVTKAEQSSVEIPGGESTVSMERSINNALRLNLAETELRVMPFLVSCTRSQLPNSSPNAPVLHELNQAKHSSETKQRHPSSRFAELKSVCTRLLSLAAADQIGVDDGSSSASTSDADDDGDVTRLRAAPKAVSFHPSVHQTEKQRAFDLSAPVTPKLTNEMDHIVDRDLESSRNIRNPALSVSRTSTGSNVTKAEQSSVEIPGGESTVSMERFRNVHAHYLRAQSYRRALTFQKRYLLLLLGGFQYSEEAVIASLGRPEWMLTDHTNGLVNCCGGLSHPAIPTPLRRFRAAVRAAQVIFRMRHMVNRWRRSGLYSSTGAMSSSHTSATKLACFPTRFGVSAINRAPLKELTAESAFHNCSLTPTATHVPLTSKVLNRSADARQMPAHHDSRWQYNISTPAIGAPNAVSYPNIPDFPNAPSSFPLTYSTPIQTHLSTQTPSAPSDFPVKNSSSTVHSTGDSAQLNRNFLRTRPGMNSISTQPQHRNSVPFSAASSRPSALTISTGHSSLNERQRSLRNKPEWRRV
ncbi:hypothetical protein AHF37_02111 [Paragonimus kellicotti]|nr:hypothetical protein AHF37_02111 [Paragonimus kellicotti]